MFSEASNIAKLTRDLREGEALAVFFWQSTRNPAGRDKRKIHLIAGSLGVDKDGTVLTMPQAQVDSIMQSPVVALLTRRVPKGAAEAPWDAAEAVWLWTKRGAERQLIDLKLPNFTHKMAHGMVRECCTKLTVGWTGAEGWSEAAAGVAASAAEEVAIEAAVNTVLTGIGLGAEYNARGDPECDAYYQSVRGLGVAAYHSFDDSHKLSGIEAAALVAELETRISLRIIDHTDELRQVDPDAALRPNRMPEAYARFAKWVADAATDASTLHLIVRTKANSHAFLQMQYGQARVEESRDMTLTVLEGFAAGWVAFSGRSVQSGATSAGAQPHTGGPYPVRHLLCDASVVPHLPERHGQVVAPALRPRDMQDVL